jgi:hypothetical protein
MVQLDPTLLDSFLTTSVGFGLISFYLFSNHYFYPFFLQTIFSDGSFKTPIPVVQTTLGDSLQYDEFMNLDLLYPEKLFFSSNYPFSQHFKDLYSNIISGLLLEKLFSIVTNERTEYFSYAVDYLFLQFESALEVFDLYCRVNQSLLRWRYGFFY